MKIIITEQQYKLIKEDSLKQSLLDNIKEYGVEDTMSLVGDFNNLSQLLNINSPMDFLHLFDDLDVVQSEENKYLTLFRYIKGDNLMIYERKSNVVRINYQKIWSILRSEFGLSPDETKSLTKKWLDEVYNLRGVTPVFCRTDGSWKRLIYTI